MLDATERGRCLNFGTWVDAMQLWGVGGEIVNVFAIFWVAETLVHSVQIISWIF